jgi:hypothetical protein
MENYKAVKDPAKPAMEEICMALVRESVYLRQRGTLHGQQELKRQIGHCNLSESFREMQVVYATPVSRGLSVQICD